MLFTSTQGQSSRAQYIDYLIAFTRTMDPNVAGNFSATIPWPKWSAQEPTLLTFQPGSTLNLMQDTYRVEAMKYVQMLQKKYPF